MPNFPDRQSHRLKWFDYSSARTYFVTICTYEHDHFFGRIRNEKMYLNEVGRTSRSVWLSIPDRFLGVQLADFVFMPNHFHGLVIIYRRTNVQNMPKRFRAQKQALMEEQIPQLKEPYKRPHLGEIVRTFKAASTRLIRKAGTHNFAWQENYWEEVIRSCTRKEVLRNYILRNPERWEKDKLYKPES